MTQTIDPSIVTAVVAEYLTTIVTPTEIDFGPGFYDPRQAILDDIATNDGGEVIYELLDTTWRMGLREPGESTATYDAWWDAMFDALPQVAAALISVA